MHLDPLQTHDMRRKRLTYNASTDRALLAEAALEMLGKFDPVVYGIDLDELGLHLDLG